MAFFIGWPHVYQYFFVFACCFCAIFVTGHVRNFFIKRRISRHLREHGFLAETNPMTREENIVTMGKDQLFGINQLLYGHYTDGVHVIHTSFSNTPTTSVPGSRSTSRRASLDGRGSVVSGPGASAIRDTYLQPAKAERKVEAYSPETGSRSSGESSSQPAPLRSYAARKYTPSTPSRLSIAFDSDFGLLSSVINVGRDENDSEKRASESFSFQSVESSGRTGSTGATSVELSLDDTAQSPKNGKEKVDLRSLSNHRMSHVAETGQFSRKRATPGAAVEPSYRAAYRALTAESESDEDVVIPVKPRPSGAPATYNPLRSNPFNTPDSSRASSSMLLAEGSPTEDVRLPLLELTAPTPDIQRTSFGITEPEAAHRKRDSYFEHARDSEVYRKVNANFEVSRTGKKLDITEALELGTFNPDSYPELEEDEKRQSRKLQKKLPNRVSTVSTEDATKAATDKRRSSWFHFSHPNRKSSIV